MNTNPFNYGDPVPSADLIDRGDEVSLLLRLAEGGHNSRVLAPRRYGKTSLLLKVLTDAELAGFRTVYVDSLLVTTASEVARRIEEAYRARLTGSLRQLIARLGRSWRGRARATPGGIGGEVEYVGVADVMQRLSDLLDLPRKILDDTGQRTVVVFDEFQDFLRADDALAGLLRSKIQLHGDTASYIFCGSEQAFLEAQFGDRRKPLFDQARPLYLEPLPDVDLGDYVEERFRQTGRGAGDALDLLLELVRGHPQRAMLLAHHLWEQTPAGQVADTATFEAAMDAVDRELQERFENTWMSYSGKPNQRRVLKALALSRETLFNQRTLAAFDLNKGQAQSGEEGLKRAGELGRAGGHPQIVDPLFERWIQLTSSREAPDLPPPEEQGA